MNISTVRMGKYLLFFALLGCCLTVTSGHITIGAEEPVFPTESSYVDVELREIFRDLAETGRFRVLFANRFQKRATMIIAAGAPVKKTTAEIENVITEVVRIINIIVSINVLFLGKNISSN